MLWGVLFACSDHRLYGVEAPPEDSGPAPVDSADVPDTADTGEPAPTPCEPEASLEAGDEAGVIEVPHGDRVVPLGVGRVGAEAAVWVLVSPAVDGELGQTAATPLDAAAFVTGGLPEGGPSVVDSSAGWLDFSSRSSATGLTIDDAHPGEALLIGDYANSSSRAWWMVVPPGDGPLDLSQVPPSFFYDQEASDAALAADLDGDGLDDMLVWHAASRSVLTAPYTTTRTLADVEQEWPYRIDGTFLDGSVGTFADLDGDGHVDYVQRWARYDANEAELRWFRGPLVERADLSAPDGYVALVGADRFGSARNGEDRGVGDVSGDGRDDVVTPADVTRDPGPDAVYLIDEAPTGGREVEEFTRLENSAFEPAFNQHAYRVGDPGDWNGDGFADLVLFLESVESRGDPARAWLVAGPVTGDVDLATDATPLTLSTKLVDSNQVWASLVPDLTGDGADDLVAMLGADEATSPAELWLFPGCAE